MVPPWPELDSTIAAVLCDSLHTRVFGLRAWECQELFALMASHAVVDITRNKGGGSNSGPSIKEINVRKLKEAELRREVEQLQAEIVRLLASRKPGYQDSRRAEATRGEQTL